MSSKTESNVLETCSELQIDAVPDQPREYLEKQIKDRSRPISGTNEEMSNKSKPRPKVMKSPHESKPTHKCKHTSSSKPQAKAPPQTQGVSHVTYNISNTRDIQIGNKYTFNLGSNETIVKSHPPPSKDTSKIKKLLKNNDPITLGDISLVSTHVGLTWREMGRHLKYTGGQLEQFDADYGREGLKEVVYQLLLDWKQANTSEASVNILCSALWASNQYDAMTEWAKVRT